MSLERWVYKQPMAEGTDGTRYNKSWYNIIPSLIYTEEGVSTTEVVEALVPIWDYSEYPAKIVGTQVKVLNRIKEFRSCL